MHVACTGQLSELKSTEPTCYIYTASARLQAARGLVRGFFLASFPGSRIFMRVTIPAYDL